jgi:hypothetical protein
MTILPSRKSGVQEGYDGINVRAIGNHKMENFGKKLKIVCMSC